LFAGAGAAGAAVLLAACSDGTPASNGSSPASATSSAPAQSPAASPSSGSGGGEVVAKTAEIPVGGGMIFPDKGVVVTQPTAGTFKGFSNICTHQQCPLTDVTNGTINCSCHFSKYSITDGSVVSPPAPRPLPAVNIKVDGSDIKLA
jgi:Rieske Fe-S protein